MLFYAPFLTIASPCPSVEICEGMSNAVSSFVITRRSLISLEMFSSSRSLPAFLTDVLK